MEERKDYFVERTKSICTGCLSLDYAEHSCLGKEGLNLCECENLECQIR